MSVCVPFYRRPYSRHYSSSQSMKEKHTVTPQGASKHVSSYVKPSIMYNVSSLFCTFSFLKGGAFLISVLYGMHGSHRVIDITQSVG